MNSVKAINQLEELKKVITISKLQLIHLYTKERRSNDGK